MEKLSDLELIAILKVYGLKYMMAGTIMSIGSKNFSWFIQANKEALDAFDELVLRKGLINCNQEFNKQCNLHFLNNKHYVKK
jgi:hypothetical protein